jgi:hypothetical protein
MSVVSVSYDLHQPGRAYEKIEEAVKGLAVSYGRILASMWLLETNYSPIEVFDRISAVLDANDSLVVGVFDQPAKWRGVHSSWNTWLPSKLPA